MLSSMDTLLKYTLLTLILTTNLNADMSRQPKRTYDKTAGTEQTPGYQPSEGLRDYVANAVNDAEGITPEEVSAITQAATEAATEAAIAAAAKTYYIDGDDGDDGNNGLTPQTAKRTFSEFNGATSDARILLKRGAVYRDRLHIGSRNFVGAYGNGPRPEINAADIVSGWALVSGKAATYALAHDFEDSLSDVIHVVQDGQPLRYVSSIDAVETNEGTYHLPVGAKSGAMIYCHPRGGGSPDGNGSTFEIPVRKNAVDCWNDNTLIGIALANNTHNDGTLKTARNTALKNCVLKNGTKHIAYFGGSCHVEDTVFLYCSNRNVLQNASHVVVHAQTLEDNICIFRNVVIRDYNDLKGYGIGILSHGDSGSNRLVYFYNARFIGLGRPFGSMQSQLTLLDSCEFLDIAKMLDATGNNHYYFNRCKIVSLDSALIGVAGFFNSARNTSGTNGLLTMRGCTGLVAAARLFSGGWRAIDISYCTFAYPGERSSWMDYAFADFKGGYQKYYATPEKFRFSYNVVKGWHRVVQFTTASLNFVQAGGDVYVDHNILIGGASDVAKFDDGSTDPIDLIGWQQSTGWDANSSVHKIGDVSFVGTSDSLELQLVNAPIGAGHMFAPDTAIDLEDQEAASYLGPAKK